MKKTLAVLTLIASLVPAAALAQDDRRSTVDPVTEYTFTDGDRVPGTRQSPWDEIWSSRLRGRRDTLVRPRPHYIPEMLKSVENL